MNNTNKVITLSEQSTKMAGYRAELKINSRIKNKEKEKDEIQAQIDSVLEKYLMNTVITMKIVK